MEIDYRALERSKTRTESMRSLRFRTETGSLSDKSPDRVEIVVKLVGDWPTISFGGCRYLHQARHWFTKQYQLLTSLSEVEGMNLFNEQLSTGATRYLTFGIPELELVNWREERSAPGTGLLLHPGLARPSFVFDVNLISAEDLRRRASSANKPLKEGILEWARFDLHRVEMFFDRLEASPPFKDCFSGYYDPLRCLYHRATGQIPPVSPTLDTALMSKAEGILQNEIRLEEACKAEWLIRRERVDYLLAAKENGWLGQLVGIENELPRLPKRVTSWIPRYQPRLVSERQSTSATGSGEPSGSRKRPFRGDHAVENQIAKRRRATRLESCTRPCRTVKMQRSSSRIVRLVESVERSLSPEKRELVERTRSRRRSLTPFPADVPNRIIAKVLTEETEHSSLGRVTRASEKKRKAAEGVRPRRVFTYDEEQENRPRGEDEEWLDREEFCKQYEFED